MRACHPRFPEILYVSNIKENGRDAGHTDAGCVWRTDMSHTARRLRATMLYALELPVENRVALGNTLFASAEHAHDSLTLQQTRARRGLRDEIPGGASHRETLVLIQHGGDRTGSRILSQTAAA